MKGIPFTGYGAQTVQNLCAGSGSGRLRAVGAVVGDYEYIPQMRGIVLLQDAVDQVPDDRLLVPGSHHDGKTRLGRGRGAALPPHQREGGHRRKVEGKDLQTQGQNKTYDIQVFHGTSPSHHTGNDTLGRLGI